jgi:hypothetical protein
VAPLPTIRVSVAVRLFFIVRRDLEGKGIAVPLGRAAVPQLWLPSRDPESIDPTALRDGSRQNNDPFKEFEDVWEVARRC